MNAEYLVAQEREHQRSKGFTHEHDIAEHGEDGELPMAAACYAQWASEELDYQDHGYTEDEGHPFWPWPEPNQGCNWKPNVSLDAMVKAAAMLHAQIDIELSKMNLLQP